MNKKKWNVSIEAETEQEAVKLLTTLLETFKFAAITDKPLHHVFLDLNEQGNKLICTEHKTVNS